MKVRAIPGKLAMVAGTVLALAIPTLAPARSAAAAESLSVNLASVTGPATGVGEGFLYGMSQDGTQPADQYLQPLGITAFRGGGQVSGGWIRDGYTYGSGTQADVNSIIAQARRLTQSPYHAQYQVILSDIYGRDGGQPSNTVYPCNNGNCSNWVTFIDDGGGRAAGLRAHVRLRHLQRAGHLESSGRRGVNTTQYFQMWDTAYQEIRRVAPNATIVGPDFAFTPQQNQGEWQTWLAHVKSSGHRARRDHQPRRGRRATTRWPCSRRHQQRPVRRRHLARIRAVGERVPARRTGRPPA